VAISSFSLVSTLSSWGIIQIENERDAEQSGMIEFLMRGCDTWRDACNSKKTWKFDERNWVKEGSACCSKPCHLPTQSLLRP
jgi:hypothetical protein